MAKFKHTVITKKGHALMAKALANESQIKFVDIKTSDYTFADGTDLEAVETLENIKQTIGISDVKVQNDTTVEVSGVLSNKNLAEGYYCSAVALYAKDGDTDIIYSITVADQADWVPADNGTSATSVLFKLVTAVSNAANVSLNVDPLMFATVAQINELRTRLDKIDDADTPIEHVQTLTSVQRLPDGALDGTVSGLEIDGLSLVNQTTRNVNNWVGTYGATVNQNGTAIDLTVAQLSDIAAYQRLEYKNTNGIKVGDKYFCYTLIKPMHDLSGAYLNICSQNTTQTQIKTNIWNEIYGIVTGTNVAPPRIYYFAGGSGDYKIGEKISFDKIAFINMTALGIDNYTEEQMLALVRGGYIDGLQGVSKPSVKVVGKNLFDIERHFTKKFLNWSKGNLLCTQRVKKGVSYRIQTFYKKIGVVGQGGVAIIFGDTIPPKKSTWFVSTSYGNRICAYEHNEQYIDTVYTPDTDGYISIYAGTLDIKATISLENTMLIEESKYSGNYEPYHSSTLTANVELRSLPNGVKDRIYMQDGNLMLEKRVGEYVISDETVMYLHTNYNSLMLVTIKLPNNYNYNHHIDGYKDYKSVVWKYPCKIWNNDSGTEVGGFHYVSDGNRDITMCVEKGKYTNLEQAHSDFNGEVIHYELATPKIINLTKQGLTDGILESIKGGTCIVDSNTFIPPRVSFGVPTDLGAQVSSLLSGQNALSKAVGAKADRVQEEWIPLVLLNDWVPYADDWNVGFYKDELGIVHLDGLIKDGVGVGSTVIAILPAGYRPKQNQWNVAPNTQSNIDTIWIGTDGKIRVVSTSSTILSFAGVSFKAER